MTFSSFMCTKNISVPPVRFYYQYAKSGSVSYIYRRIADNFSTNASITIPVGNSIHGQCVIRGLPPNHNYWHSTSSNLSYVILSPETDNYNPGIACVNLKTMSYITYARYTQSGEIETYVLNSSGTNIYLQNSCMVGHVLFRLVRLSDLATLASYTRQGTDLDSYIFAVDANYLYTFRPIGNAGHGNLTVGIARRSASNFSYVDYINTGIYGSPGSRINELGYSGSGFTFGSYLYFTLRNSGGGATGPGGICRVDFPTLNNPTYVLLSSGPLKSAAFDGTGTYCYVVSDGYESNTLSKFRINTTPMTLEQTVSIQYSPYDVIFDPESNYIHVIYAIPNNYVDRYTTSLQFVQRFNFSGREGIHPGN